MEERNREGNKGNGQKMRGGRQEEQQHDVQTSLSQKGDENTEGVLKRTSKIKKEMTFSRNANKSYGVSWGF